MPWHFDGSATARPRNAVGCHVYRGINVLTFAIAAYLANYPTGLWATYRHRQLAGAQVREGERGTMIVFWKILDRSAQPYVENEDDDTPRRIVARGFWLFNLVQVDNYIPVALNELSEAKREAQSEKFCAQLGLRRSSIVTEHTTILRQTGSICHRLSDNSGPVPDFIRHSSTKLLMRLARREDSIVTSPAVLARLPTRWKR